MTKLLVGMTGSLALLSMPSYLSMFRKHFSHLKIIMTHTAIQLIPKETFSMFSDGIYTEEFPLSRENMGHVELARWADLFVILPATAHLLFQAAHGDAGTLLSATLLAYERRAIFFPNMNAAMWKKAAVQKNISLLQEEGHKVISPLERPAFEYASREIEMNPVLPSPESVVSILKLEIEVGAPLIDPHAISR